MTEYGAKKDRAGFGSCPFLLLYSAVREGVPAPTVHIGLEGDGLAYVPRVSSVGQEFVQNFFLPVVWTMGMPVRSEVSRRTS